MTVHRVWLGGSGLHVSRLAFGTAFMGPQSDRMSPQAGASLLLQALARGVSFWDTADDYGTHVHVARALRQVPRERAVVASKTREPAGAVERLLADLATDYLDLLFLHEVGLAWAEEAREALRSWQGDVARGRVRAVGLATHSAQVARLAAHWPEANVLLLPINPSGVCTSECSIEDGDVQDMLAAAQRAWERGKGVVAMKVMGCGAFAGDPGAAISYVARLPAVHSLCIGMRDLREIEENAHWLALADATRTANGRAAASTEAHPASIASSGQGARRWPLSGQEQEGQRADSKQ
jgi:aryl-alcohol dehydrogenase-like predicted oxidoreductase